MRKSKFFAAFAGVLLAASTGAFAVNVGPGLGNVILAGQSGPVFDMLAVTTNNTFFSNLFAITFGTSGYNGGLIGKAETDQFIADNLDALAVDIASGDGEYVDALSSMLNVSDAVAFKSTLQENFDNIFTSADVSAEEVSSKIYSFVS